MKRKMTAAQREALENFSKPTPMLVGQYQQERKTMKTVTVRGVNFFGNQFAIRKTGYAATLTIDGREYRINHPTERAAGYFVAEFLRQYPFSTEA